MTTSDQDRQGLVTVTRAAGLAISEFIIQLDFVHPDATERAQRISHAADAIRAVAASISEARLLRHR